MYHLYTQVDACRARLYRMEGTNADGETPQPTTSWRESCKKAIIPEVSLFNINRVKLNRASPIYLQDVSNTHRDAIFSQASFPRGIWELACEVMDLFEQAKTKRTTTQSFYLCSPSQSLSSSILLLLDVQNRGWTYPL